MVFYIHIYCCWCVGALGAHIQSVVAALDSACASLSSSSFNYHENFRTYMISVLESFNTIMVNTMTLMMGMGEHTATHHTMRQQSMCLKGVVLDHYSTVHAVPVQFGQFGVFSSCGPSFTHNSVVRLWSDIPKFLPQSPPPFSGQHRHKRPSGIISTDSKQTCVRAR